MPNKKNKTVVSIVDYYQHAKTTGVNTYKETLMRYFDDQKPLIGFNVIYLEAPYDPYSTFIPSAEFPTESQYLSFLSEHYSSDYTVFYKYLLYSDTMSQFRDDSTVSNQIFDPNAINSDVPSESIMNALNTFFERIDLFYEDFMTALANIQFDLTEFAIIATGQGIGKLDTLFEQALFKKYWAGDGSDYFMSENDMARLISDYNASDLPKYDSNTIKSNPSILRPEIDNNGNVFYLGSLNGYELGNKYDYSFGVARAIYNSLGELVGIYDYYDFDPADRTGMAEFATRAVNAVSHPGVAEFHIMGGCAFRDFR